MQSYYFYHCYYCVLILSATLFIPTVSHGKLINSNVKIVSSRPLHKSPSFCGESGIPFDDVEFFNGPDESPIAMILAVNVSSSSFFIDSIQVLYFLANFSDSQTPIRGTPKNLHYIALDISEHIALVEGSTNGVAVTQLTMTTMGTNGSTTYGPFGKAGGTKFSFQGYIAGFYGRSENLLTNIGVYYYDELKKSQEFGGGYGGSRFDDHTDINSPPIVGISTLTLWHGAFLNGIQAEYVVQGGNKLLGEVHGGTNSTLRTTITLKPGETLEHAEFGYTQGYFITLLNFTIRRTSGGTEVLGPFGNKGFPAYKFDGNILGFHGHGEEYIYKLGFYYDQTVV